MIFEAKRASIKLSSIKLNQYVDISVDKYTEGQLHHSKVSVIAMFATVVIHAHSTLHYLLQIFEHRQLHR